MKEWTEEERWAETYAGRFDRMLCVKTMLEDWWPKTTAEKKKMEAIIAKIENYLDFLDEE